jgi:hypothetical protein
MATYQIPPNIGKVRVAMALGGKFVVWNGKQGRDEFTIVCRNRRQAEQIARLLNSKPRPTEVEVT